MHERSQARDMWHFHILLLILFQTTWRKFFQNENQPISDIQDRSTDTPLPLGQVLLVFSFIMVLRTW